MSRVERVKEYANPRRRENWNGESTAANISRWADRASANSKIAPRAKGGEMRLPDTDKMDLHSTSDAPRRDKDVDKRAMAKADKNHLVDASPFMKDVRRNA